PLHGPGHGPGQGRLPGREAFLALAGHAPTAAPAGTTGPRHPAGSNFLNLLVRVRAGAAGMSTRAARVKCRPGGTYRFRCGPLGWRVDIVCVQLAQYTAKCWCDCYSRRWNCRDVGGRGGVMAEL